MPSEKLTRPTNEHDRADLKHAFRRLVKACRGGESAAAVTRVGQPHISTYGNPRIEDQFAPIDVVADLERDAEAAIVTRELARLAGGVFVPLPAAGANTDWAREIGGVAKEAGEAVSRLCEALSKGGTITAAEIRNMGLRPEVKEAIEALVIVDKHLERVATIEERDE